MWDALTLVPRTGVCGLLPRVAARARALTLSLPFWRRTILCINARENGGHFLHARLTPLSTSLAASSTAPWRARAAWCMHACGPMHLMHGHCHFLRVADEPVMKTCKFSAPCRHVQLQMHGHQGWPPGSGHHPQALRPWHGMVWCGQARSAARHLGPQACARCSIAWPRRAALACAVNSAPTEDVHLMPLASAWTPQLLSTAVATAQRGGRMLCVPSTVHGAGSQASSPPQHHTTPHMLQGPACY